MFFPLYMDRMVSLLRKSDTYKYEYLADFPVGSEVKILGMRGVFRVIRFLDYGSVKLYDYLTDSFIELPDVTMAVYV